MIDLWHRLGGFTQDVLFLVGLIMPLALTGVLLLRGFAPWPLVRALLRRYLWINLIFTGLITLAVAMGTGLIAQERAVREGTARAADKFDMVIGAPGSELTLMLASVFLEPAVIPLLSGDVYNEIAETPQVAFAAPLGFGDSYAGAPVVGTTMELVEHMADGRLEGAGFSASLDAIAGAEIDLLIGDTFVPAHGVGAAAEEGLHEDIYTVVGRLPPTGSPWDRAIIVPIEGVWETHGLASGHREPGRLGPPYVAELFPGTPAIVVRPDNLPAAYAIRNQFDRREDTMAIFPGLELAGLYALMGDLRDVMSILLTVTQLIAAASVLTGLFVLSRLFARQLDLLAVLGAPQRFSFAVLWSYATTLLIVGTLLGLVFGIGVSAFLSGLIAAESGVATSARLGLNELHLAAGFVTLASLTALIPAMIAGRRPANLTLR